MTTDKLIAHTLPVNGKAASGLDYFVAVASPAPGTYLGPLDEKKSKEEPACFKPLKIRSLTLKNRINLSPMAQYHSPAGTGLPTDYHLIHYGAFAMRGVALVMTEATSMMPNGRMTPTDVGIWDDSQIAGWKRVTDFVHTQGAYMGLQINHAGFRAGAYPPYVSIDMPEVNSVVVPQSSGGWKDIWSPSGVRYHESYGVASEMTLEDCETFKQHWFAAVRRGIKAGFDVCELHVSHGYMLHQFLSPYSNKRTDKYGGDLAGRMRLVLEIVEETRKIWPADKPVFVRLSCTDDHKEGEFAKDGSYLSWGIEQSKIFVGELIKLGVDLVDCSSGGLVADQKDYHGPPYNVGHARALKEAYPNLLIGTVGLITTPEQVEQIIQEGTADTIFLARALLRNADFVGHIGETLGARVQTAYPYQFGRSFFGAAPGPTHGH